MTGAKQIKGAAYLSAAFAGKYVVVLHLTVKIFVHYRGHGG
jgi:hypothetical protein